MNKLVSIIIPVYNAAFFLEETLHSVALQTYNNWELVIINDGSTDNSTEICCNFANKHQGKCLLFQSHKKQSGAGSCRNIGIKKSNGDYIIFLDSDDTLASFCLQQRVSAIQTNDMAIFKQYYWETNNLQPYNLFTGKAENREDAIKAFLKMEAPWQTMATIWHKSALQKLNGFDENLVYMEDPDLHLRALYDNEIKILFAYDLPADNFYRVNNMPYTKAENFYYNSITSRIVFLEKIVTISNNNFQYKKYIREGYITFLKNFVLARFNIYKEPIITITKKLGTSKILNKIDIIKLKFIFSVFQSSSILVKKLKLKGLVFKLIK